MSKGEFNQFCIWKEFLSSQSPFTIRTLIILSNSSFLLILRMLKETSRWESLTWHLPVVDTLSFAAFFLSSRSTGEKDARKEIASNTLLRCRGSLCAAFCVSSSCDICRTETLMLLKGNVMSANINYLARELNGKVRKSISSHSREITSCRATNSLCSSVGKLHYAYSTRASRAQRSVEVNRKFKHFMYFKILLHFVEYWLEQKALMHSGFFLLQNASIT